MGVEKPANKRKNKPAKKRKNGGREAVQFKLPIFLVKFPSRKFPGPANK